MVAFPRIPEDLYRLPPGVPFEVRNRESRRYLEIINEQCETSDYAYSWGFTIYRTVFTSELDATFPVAMEHFNERARWSIISSVKSDADTEPDDELLRRYQNHIIEDKSLDSASTETIGARFAEYVEEQVGPDYWGDNTRYRICLVIDQKALDQLLQMPDLSDMGTEKWYLCCTVVTCGEQDEYNGGDYFWF